MGLNRKQAQSRSSRSIWDGRLLQSDRTFVENLSTVDPTPTVADCRPAASLHSVLKPNAATVRPASTDAVLWFSLFKACAHAACCHLTANVIQWSITVVLTPQTTLPILACHFWTNSSLTHFTMQWKWDLLTPRKVPCKTPRCWHYCVPFTFVFLTL
jgi:hypothetical protein